MARPLGFLSLALGAVFASAPAHSDEPAPRWDVGEICASPSQGADGRSPNCPRIESQNRRSLLLRWQAIPVEDRRACKAEVTESGKLSYKQLLNCLEVRQLKALDEGPQSATSGQSSS